MKRFFFIIGALLSCMLVSAQDNALKTRLTKLALLSFDAGVECKLASKLTADVSATYNPWTFTDNRKWKVLMADTQLRYWPCREYFGWFVGGYVHGGCFNFGNIPFGDLRTLRREGWFVGAGADAGYQLVLTKKLNLEFELGAGYAFYRSVAFEYPVCGLQVSENLPGHYWGLTKANVALVFFF